MTLGGIPERGVPGPSRRAPNCTGLSYSSTDRRDLLPLPVLINHEGTSVGMRRRARRRAVNNASSIACTNTVIQGINTLYGGGPGYRLEAAEEGNHTISGISKSKTNACQRLATHLLSRVGRWESTRIAHSAGASCSRSEVSNQSLHSDQWYTTENVPNWGSLWLKPELVSLPPEGIAGSVDFLPLLTDELRDLYSSPEKLLRKELPSESMHQKPFKGIDDTNYLKLVKILVGKGMIELWSEKPAVINGLFGVPKDIVLQRLIIDARNANMFFADPPDVDLPNPGILADMYLEKGCTLAVAKTDFDNFYHRFLLPRWMRKYFGLPSLWIEGELVSYTHLTLPTTSRV